MQKVDIQNPNERKKLILAGVLGMVAILLLWWAFFGFGGSSNKTPPRTSGQIPPSVVTRATPSNVQPSKVVELNEDILARLRPIKSNYSPVSAPEARRNIFVFYEPPVKPVVVAEVPTPTPTPVPPVLLASVSPANVYARTGDFTLEVTGDKFTSQLRVVIDNNELPTRYVGPQQLSAAVPAALIASPGTRQVMLRSPDGKLYSNAAALNIAAPPTPNYTYVGIIGTRYIDTAILQDKGSKETLNVQRGDLLGGRFRVTSISEKELVLVDANLKIKHTLALTSQSDRGGNPLQRPTPKVDSEDDEP